MGIARELPVAIQAAEEEAEHDLPDPIALGLRSVLQLLEPGPPHELADEHPLARQRADDVGDDDERVPGEDAGERTLVLGLELVVELLADPLLDLLGDRLHVHSGVIRLSTRMIMSRFCRSARTAAATPGYWTLTATSRPSFSVAR